MMPMWLFLWGMLVKVPGLALALGRSICFTKYVEGEACCGFDVRSVGAMTQRYTLVCTK